VEKIKQYDSVLLQDGREGIVVEVYGEQEVFDIDIGSSPKDWETITVKLEGIDKIITP